MIYLDVERLKFSVEPIAALMPRPYFSRILFDCMTTDNKVVLVIGGFDANMDKSPLKDTHIFSVRGKTWSKGPVLNHARWSAGACRIEGHTYVFFGSKGCYSEAQ